MLSNTTTNLFINISNVLQSRIGRHLYGNGSAGSMLFRANADRSNGYYLNLQVIDLEDGTFAEGHFGVNVFGGQAFYQNVRVE
ncbi:hypothetical protein ABH894_003149 [Paenibacillus sp. RC62]